MSLRAQIAFGRNFTLQKQLEDQYLNIRQRFKHSRRRQDAFEEECVDSLYKILLYAKGKQDTDKPGPTKPENVPASRPKSSFGLQSNRRSRSVFEISKSKELDVQAEVSKRPATAMSSKTYTQSYSFKKEGMNIDRSRRDRYLQKKKDIQSEQDIKNDIKFESITTKDKCDLEEALYKAAQEKEHRENNEARANLNLKMSELMSGNDVKVLPKRPHTSHSLQFADSVRSPTPAVLFSTTTPLPPSTDYPDGKRTQVSSNDHGILKQSPALKRSDTSTPTLVTVHEGKLTIPNGEKSPMFVKIKATKLNEDYENDKLVHNGTPRADSRFDNVVEEELVPLTDDDKQQLEELTLKQEGNTSNPRVGSQSAMLTSGNSEAETSLNSSVNKTEEFLTHYSKKSKIFGYVVKTRLSTLAPRERTRSYRSPCITYQELVSIKANIKQHESRTKSLLQRSAKLSSYVDKLATASRLREHIKDLRKTKASGR